MKNYSVFELHDTHGYPIEEIAREAMDRDLLIIRAYHEAQIMIKWIPWVKDAVKAGWSYDKINRTITNVLDENYGTSWHSMKWAIPVVYLGLTKNR